MWSLLLLCSRSSETSCETRPCDELNDSWSTTSSWFKWVNEAHQYLMLNPYQHFPMFLFISNGPEMGYQESVDETILWWQDLEGKSPIFTQIQIMIIIVWNLSLWTTAMIGWLISTISHIYIIVPIRSNLIDPDGLIPIDLYRQLYGGFLDSGTPSHHPFQPFQWEVP